MAFPTTSVQDTATRADGDAGANWSPDTFGAAGDWRISTNTLRRDAGDAYTEEYWNPSTPGPDCEAYATASAKPQGAAFAQWGVTLRVQSPGSTAADGYKCTIYGHTFGSDVSGDVHMYRIDNGVETQLGATIAGTHVDGDQFGADMIGTTLTTYRNGTVVDSRTDGTYTGAGRIGLHTYDPGDTGRYVNFGGGTIAAVGDAPPPLLVMAAPTPGGV